MDGTDARSHAAPRTGGCLCGQVRYSASAQPLRVVCCHCRDCQKQSGSALSLIAVFPRDSLSFSGDISCFEGTADSGLPVLRHFCGRCGSPLYSDNGAMQDRGILAIKAGTLDDVSDLAPQAHLWTVSKHAWLDLPDGIACVDRQ
jgi:hypothetical protein